MSRYLTLCRNCFGMSTRIECAALPLDGGRGLWVLICAAGLSDSQPSSVKAQGPFHGAFEVEAVMGDVACNLQAMGYETCLDMPIWRLHIQAELRRTNARGSVVEEGCQGVPEP
ncbi:hypothetical protein WG219_17700 [Ectopseudomonas mendocina]|uniref:Uncharacterized protein n=1 Tax=Ectopseudomonas mendocina TaxID=300 RepID=A0ABZ2RES9_ECTME